MSGDIKLEDIKSEIKIDDKNENYYVTNVDTPFTKPLRDFHNLIKSKLIGAIGTTSDLPINKTIMDTSIGRGGDIKKYENKKINCKFLFGLDISPVEEACNRYYFNKKDKTMSAVFIKYIGKNIKNLSYLDDLDDVMRIIAKYDKYIIYQNSSNIDSEYNSIIKNT